jgi:hypothetical protein
LSADAADIDGESDAPEEEEDESTGELMVARAEDLSLAKLVLMRSRAFGFLFGKMQEIKRSSKSWQSERPWGLVIREEKWLQALWCLPDRVTPI